MLNQVWFMIENFSEYLWLSTSMEAICIEMSTYSVALRSVRNDILVTGCTTAKNLSNDIKTNVYTLA